MVRIEERGKDRSEERMVRMSKGRKVQSQDQVRQVLEERERGARELGASVAKAAAGKMGDWGTASNVRVPKRAG